MRPIITRRPSGRLSPLASQLGSGTIQERVLGEAISRGSCLPDPDGQLRTNSLRVLLVDDCPFQRLLSCTLLARWGIQPEIACDGLEAVLLVGEQVFDMVLMDLRMPVMDGLTATARLRVVEREQRRPRSVPVIAYTAESIAGNAWALSGITAALAKPCDAFQLGECLQRWCGIELGVMQH
jgi:two-component system, sensor histidine kinase and response regulator